MYDELQTLGAAIRDLRIPDHLAAETMNVAPSAAPAKRHESRCWQRRMISRSNCGKSAVATDEVR
jgi:hypothetical protein